ncbi:MAG: hypothetical protein EOP09_13225 [Proteobacteria bacterium]|nr:MAG: hypothetical protein EOP09_13225 [Pseudomonadota bacterium]
MTNLEYAQWNAQVHSSLGRNVGAMMAGYGKNWVDKGWFDLTPTARSSIRIDAVANFEGLYEKLVAPQWAELAEMGVVEPLDPIRVSRGKALYASACLQCHAIQPDSTAKNDFGNAFWKTPVFSPEYIGTDPAYTRDEYDRTSKANPLAIPIFKKAYGADIVDSAGHVPAAASRGLLVGAVIQNYFRENNISESEMLRMTNCRNGIRPQPAQGIRARSLEGVIFTAPYLHNGSVASMRELLSPQTQRAKTFFLGCRKYDPVNMGYDCREHEPGVFLLDTSKSGNSNSGHEYGTHFNDAEKHDLIEYLKSLTQPKAPERNPECI